LSRQSHAAPRRGVALLLVLSCLVLLAALILGFLLSGQNNLKSSKLYANGSSVKTLADSTVSLVMAEIQQATSNGTTVAWASQPGMIRTYDSTGTEQTNYRLFSWDSPTTTGTYDPSTDAGSLTGNATWYSSPAVYFDLNQPVTDSSGILHFPIVDGNPTDLGHTGGDTSTSNYNYATASGTIAVSTYSINGVTPGIEGFWVNLPNTTGGPAVNTSTSSASNHNTNDIPMPVKWLYVLQDGTIVAPAAGSTGTKITVNGAKQANPIVGRIAYWTDDETSKVNINTASEGVYWDTPRTNGSFDQTNLAQDQPTQNEFQRYPGHPAMTCLSTVLGAVLSTPSTLHTGMGASPYTSANFKPYYVIAPKLNMGSLSQTTNLGSNAGTAAPVSGSSGSSTGVGSTSFKANERLYASVDELAFESGLANGLSPTSLPGGGGVTATSSYVRTTNNDGVNSTIAAANSSSSTSATGQFLEKARFFLTASSRAPDVNMFNQPRIVCWPVASSITNQTATDSTIAWDGTINGKRYYFVRSRNDDPTADLPLTVATSGVGRNRALLTYLENLGATNIPGFGGSFLTKYDSTTATYASGGGTSVTNSKQAAELDQILVEMFDYVRCLNLVDPNVTTPFAPAVGGVSTATKPPPAFDSGLSDVWTSSPAQPWGGFGQAVPIIDTAANGYTYSASSNTMSGGTRGFGRFPTVEGATLLFICTGWNDGLHGTWKTSDPNYNAPQSGLGDPSAWSWSARPPPGYAGGTTASPTPWTSYMYNGTSLIGTTTSATAIPDGCVRIQAMLIVNMFDPSLGFPTENGNYHLQVSGLDGFTWKTSLSGTAPATSMGFPNSVISAAVNTASYTKGMTNWVFSPNSRDNWGGKMNPLNLIWGTGPGINAGTQGYYPFFSNTMDVPYDPTASWVPGQNPQPFSFFGGPITINVLIPQTTTHTASGWLVNQPVQTIKLTFPSQSFPTPILTWRAPSPFGTSTLINRFPFGNRLTFGSDSWAPQYTLIQPQDVTRSVRAYPGDIRIIAGRTVADGTSDFNLFDDANQSHFSEYNVPVPPLPPFPLQEHNHDIWSVASTPLFGVRWGQLVNSSANGMGSYNGSTNGNPFGANTSLHGATNGTSYSGPGGGSSALDTTLAGGGCPTNGAYITKNGVPTSIQGDFDNGFATWSDGPYINKADEGSSAYNNASTGGSSTPYYSPLYSTGPVANAGPTFFSPNRMMPSPGMFGSLPTGVIRNWAWMTLQFRPFPIGHPGIGDSTSSTGIGPPYSAITGKGPPDHLFMDLFNMPVVEPYPISEPLSTAGRVNMNYQIVPFTYIQRSTGVRAVLKAERMTVIPNSASNVYKGINSGSGIANNDTTNNYHVPINVDQTLLGFEDWFNGTTTGTKDIFRSATQICDLYLYPLYDSNSSSGPSYDSQNVNITAFWQAHLLTGDNNLERPYANIYPRLTTKSNTFTVHYCVETLKTVVGEADNTWDETKDVVTGQYRGSSTIERYVDPNDSTIPDFATGAAAISSTGPGTALDRYYKFRVVSTKQFAP